ncbi:MAG TPA: biotin/lipoyl-containing protein, partial [Chloroflexota bacterium]|nr:biotin/lipoyl-containing protein [Chloroflexota bacterium]
VAIGERRLIVRALGRGVLVDSQHVDVFCREHKCGLEWRGRSFRLERPKPLSIADTLGDSGASAGAGRLTAPMPGRIVKIGVQPGQQVKQNQPLVVLEAMKMEHVVEAPHAGVVQDVCVEVGQQVTAGAVLVELGDVE